MPEETLTLKNALGSLIENECGFSTTDLDQLQEIQRKNPDGFAITLAEERPNLTVKQKQQLVDFAFALNELSSSGENLGPSPKLTAIAQNIKQGIGVLQHLLHQSKTHIAKTTLEGMNPIAMAEAYWRGVASKIIAMEMVNGPIPDYVDEKLLAAIHELNDRQMKEIGTDFTDETKRMRRDLVRNKLIPLIQRHEPFDPEHWKEEQQGLETYKGISSVDGTFILAMINDARKISSALGNDRNQQRE